MNTLNVYTTNNPFSNTPQEVVIYNYPVMTKDVDCEEIKKVPV